MAKRVCPEIESLEENLMSLLSDAMEKCILIDKHTSADGYGGFNTTWVDGAPIDAAIVLDTSIEARIAEKQGVTGLYTITTAKNVNLQYHDVLRRVSDSKIFRITSDGDDRHTPINAGLNMRQVSAEEWILPNE